MSVRAIPEGYHSITPSIVCKNAAGAIDRFARLRDPFGHSWGIAQHVEDVSPQEMERRAAEWMSKISKTASAKA